MNKKFISSIVISGLSIMALVGSVIALSLSWFSVPGGSTDNETLDGEVGLRGYFYAGNGTEDNPFEIVSPIHFYNLTRLQNLGVFGSTKTYFQVGHVFDENIGPQCINIRDGVGVPEQVLDMGDFSTQNRILPIGGEGAPFIGEFDGQGIPIQNLKIAGYPEDIGVFGYISYEGVVNNLVCENLEVTSLGYTDTTSDKSYQLFSQDIDDIFNSSSYLATDTSLTFVDLNADSNNRHYLTDLNSVAAVTLDNINDDNNVVSNSYIYNGYFEPSFPDVDNDIFTYSWRSSSSLIKEVELIDIDGDHSLDKLIMFDMQALSESVSTETLDGFNTGADLQVDARLSLIASVEVDGFVFSRVIQSYTCEFYSNRSTSYEQGNYSVTIYCDYVDQNDPNDHNTNYHHGNNIGFLAGHVDGSLRNSYVYNGTFHFNNYDSQSESFVSIPTESQTGLIGEVGTNVVNTLNPDLGVVVHGDIGIMNFTKIYGKIRRDYNTLRDENDDIIYDVVHAGKDGDSYASYQNQRILGEDNFDLFAPYLRRINNTDQEYITKVENPGGNHNITTVTPEDPDTTWHNYTVPDSATEHRFNSVDFIFNSVIEDTDIADRGLGVFKIVTYYKNGASTNPADDSYWSNMRSNLGTCQIINGLDHDKVYFSTAEYDHTYEGQQSWGTGIDQINPLRATTIPTFTSLDSYGYPFSRDFNYCFQIDLTEQSKGKDYMYNTTSTFLANYLKTKLIDKFGAPIEPGTSRFGFMFRSSENDLLNCLSSYMPIGVPGDKKRFGDNYYPEKSIVFRIENENGANVSVVGNNADISVYSFDPTKTQDEEDKTELYTMRSTNVSSLDSHRYFTYSMNKVLTEQDPENTTYETEKFGDDMGDGGALYAHIFKLPKGDYALGAASGSSDKANIYFLAVQGQTDASIGGKDIGAVGDAYVDADFLMEPPTYQDFINDTLSKASFNFKSTFNDNSGDFNISVDTINEQKYISLSYSEDLNFVTYLLALSRSNNHIFVINDHIFDKSTHVYVS